MFFTSFLLDFSDPLAGFSTARGPSGKNHNLKIRSFWSGFLLSGGIPANRMYQRSNVSARLPGSQGMEIIHG
jgi:hypothetical protein